VAVRRQVVPVYAAGFVTAFGAHAVAANLGRYALGHHGSLWELGLLLGIYDGAEVVLKPAFGALADRTGAKPVMIGGLVLFAAASAAFVIGGDPHLLAAARLAQGTGAAAFSPAAAATVAALGGRKRTGRLFGGYGGAKGAGYPAGPVAGGALVAAGGYPALFATLAVIAIGTAAAVTVLVPRARPAPGTPAEVLGLGRRLTSAAFLQPVLLLAAATAALSAGLASCPCWPDSTAWGRSPPVPWYPCSRQPPRCCSPSPGGGSMTAGSRRPWPLPRWPCARPGSCSPSPACRA